VSRRSPDWIKLKNQQRQEFVIGGYTAPKGSRSGFGALLLGVHDDKGQLRYCGNVGTGFNADRLADIKARLDKLATDDCPFRARAGRREREGAMGQAHAGGRSLFRRMDARRPRAP
jgi:bifunctional non-homologous end joining protein LigD